MKKITVSILTTLLMLSMVFSSSVFAAEKEQSAWDSFLGLFSAKTAATSDVGVEYRGHIQNVGNYPLDGSWIQGPTELGTEGQGLRLEGFWIQLDGDVPAGAHIEYQVHVQNVGWMDPVQDGEFAGTEGRSLQIEAIKISLVDDEGVQLEDYSVVYSGHVQNVGDVGPFTNGEQLGTVGSFLRLEAIEVEIVQNPADLTEYNAALAAVTQADYTAASWTTYQAVVNANKMTEDNLQSEVDAATANITAAQASLVLVPKVTSVTAVNATQIQVVFNSPIKASSIISDTTAGTLVPNVFSVTRTPQSSTAAKNVDGFGTGFLSADGTVLTLTAATAGDYFDGTYAVTVTDTVRTTTDLKLVPFSGTFTYTDTVQPTVTGLAYNSVTGDIEATLSEPVAAVPTIVRVNGTPVSTAITFVANTNSTKIKFAKPTSVTSGSTASVYIVGAADAAGNQLVGYTGSVVITNDTTDLAVASATQSGSNVIKVVFNKSIASSAATVEGATTILLNGTPVAAGDITVTKDANDTTNKTFLIALDNTYVAPDYFYGTSSTKTLSVNFQDAVITDVFGQTMAETSKSVVMTKVTAGPVATSVKLSDDETKFEVTFDQELGSTGAASTVVLRQDGVALAAPTSIDIKGASGTADAKVLVITPAATPTAGTFTIRLTAGAVTGLYANDNLAQNLSLVVTGTAAKLTAQIDNVANNKFSVTFDKDVTSATALDLANYKLDGAAMPAGTDIYFTTANRVVELDLPDGSINIGNVGTPALASLGVSNVATADALKVTPVTADVDVIDNTPAIAQSVSVTGDTITVTFNEAIDATTAAAIDESNYDSNFEIKVGSTVLNLGATGTLTTALVPGSPEKVTMTLVPGGAGANWDRTKVITVKTLTTPGLTLTDANGVIVKSNVSVHN